MDVQKRTKEGLCDHALVWASVRDVTRGPCPGGALGYSEKLISLWVRGLSRAIACQPCGGGPPGAGPVLQKPHLKSPHISITAT
jgi:hypothetical protein